ncbi:MAG: ATP-binding cassette domain-containing protein, partial [Anaerolineae bacterium]|nr:ATP-binding cassette domain-containing protein [Anaerolineae bacterium]
MAPLIELRNVSKIYSKGLIARASTVALDNLSLTLDADKPTIMTVAGESGSGKTRLAMLLLGFIEPTEGKSVYQGKDIPKLSWAERTEFRKEVQAVFQD